MSNAISWFEIPVKNFNRARSFYETVLDLKIIDAPMPNVKYGVFPYDKDNNAVGGGIVEMDNYVPSKNGVVIYLNGGNDLAKPLSRVEAAGGSIVIPKTDIGENGYMAHILDTEENRIALHSWS